MNKSVYASLALLFSSGLLSPCINASCQETPESTKHLIENLQPDQKLTKQQREQLNAEAMKDIARMKNEMEQQEKKSDKKALQFEQKMKVSSGPITEEEQKIVEKLTEGALTTPNVFRSESGALKYLKILLKGDHSTFRFFRGYPTEDERKTYYGEAMESALSRLNPKKKAAFDVTVEILKTKREYPPAVTEAARIIKNANDKSIMPLLAELTKHPNSRTRCEAANSLLELGDADTALPVLKELIDNEASTEAITHLFEWRNGNVVKLKDERGYSILDNALNNGKPLARVEAASLLYKVKRTPKNKAKQIAIETLSSYKSMKSYGVQYDLSNSIKITVIPGSGVTDLEKASKEWIMNRRACSSAIFLLRDLKMKETIPALQKFAKQSDDKSLSKDATEIIAYINGK
jgi:hypothetical protein